MTNKSQEQGLKGEALARHFLRQSGYELLEQNWRFKKYEIDIIAKKQQTIVFVEVKTRKSNTFGEPELFVTRQKQKFLIAAAHQYILQNNIELNSRFDIVGVILTENNHAVKHLEAAFYPLLK